MLAYSHDLRLALVVVFTLLAAGCSREPAAAPAAGQGSSPADAPAEIGTAGGEVAKSGRAVTVDGVLEGMATAYRKAQTYQDAGQIHVRAKVNGEVQEDNVPLSVTFERPNRLRVHAYKGNLICDGFDLRGWMELERGQPFYGQVLAVDAPKTITLDDIYADPILTAGLTEGIAGSSPQLLLLLGADPLKDLQANAERPVLLAPEKIEDDLCYRVLMAREDGKLIFWIDQQDFTLRRVEIPIDGLRKHLEQQAKVEELGVWIELKGARLGGQVAPTAFRLTTPKGAELVSQFDRRQLLPPPPRQLGKSAPDFQVTSLAGEKITKDSLKGRIAVIDFWFTTCPPCKESLPNLETVYQKYKDNDLVRFIAVSVDEEEIKDGELESMFGELKVKVPIARDPLGKLAQSVGVSVFPTMVVLGADGVIEDFEMGYNPKLTTTLPAKLDKLLTGESIFKDVLANEYRAPSQDSEAAPTTSEGEIPKAEIAARSEPRRLKLTKLWTNKDLERPGNILVIEEGGKPRLVVNDGWQQVAELDAEGTLVGKHKLDVPEDDVVAMIRTAVDKKGQRMYLGTVSNQPQAHLFDDKWKKLVSYPADRDHAGVADAQLADLDGDGEIEMLVSYWDVVGVQGATLAGKRTWSNRSLRHVFRMAVTTPDAEGKRQLLCAHSQGTIVPINHEGTTGQPIPVGTQFLRSIHAADLDGDGRVELLALASSAAGQDTAVGINMAGEELWSHPLPRGVQKYPIEMVGWGDVLGQGQQQWLIAGPDGSIHILTGAGEIVEQFNYGTAIAGLATARINGKPALLVSTAEGVDAWTK